MLQYLLRYKICKYEKCIEEYKHKLKYSLFTLQQNYNITHLSPTVVTSVRTEDVLIHVSTGNTGTPVSFCCMQVMQSSYHNFY